MSAENVKVLPRGTLKNPTVLPDVLDGKVVRPLRSVNPEQDQYAGLIEASVETGMCSFHKFSCLAYIYISVIGLLNCKLFMYCRR